MIPLFAHRITPAYAGKRDLFRCMTRMTEDHPRIRGEKALIQGRTLAGVGSPPHTRGKGLRAVGPHDDLGITPAYAGKRTMYQIIKDVIKDHPRIRGEKRDRDGDAE